MQPHSFFAPDTRLYSRYRGNLAGEIDPLALRFFNMSVVAHFQEESSPDDARWSTMCESWSKPPEYDAGAAVIGFSAKHVPTERVVAESGRKFRFQVEHVPYDDLYQHCEIRTYLEGGASEAVESESKIPSTVKKFVKQSIADAVMREGQLWMPGAP